MTTERLCNRYGCRAEPDNTGFCADHWSGRIEVAPSAAKLPAQAEGRKNIESLSSATCCEVPAILQELSAPTIIPRGVLVRRLYDVLCEESKGGRHV
jgi:hypothetical protein